MTQISTDSNAHEVWITGIGVVSALGSGFEAHRAAVRESRTGLSTHNFFDGQAPDPCVCGRVSSRDLPDLGETCEFDRATRLLDHAVGQALDSSGLSAAGDLDIIAGTTLGNIAAASRYYEHSRAKQNPDPALFGGFLLGQPLQDVMRSRRLTARSQTICSACGSAAAAMGQAFHRIARGQAQRVLVAGFEALSPYVIAGFNSLRLVSKEPCRPFDKARAGLNPGEGAAALVLESRTSALQRGAHPLARVGGFGAALDAYHYTRAHPEGRGLAQAMLKALASARIAPEQVHHLELHGTATEANDPSEYCALRSVFGGALAGIPATSTKSMTGHTFGASAALGAVFSVIALQERMAPATLNCNERDPAFEGLQVGSLPIELPQMSTVMSTSLGFGGEAFALVFARSEADA